MSDAFDQMAKQFKTETELRIYAESQHKTILELSKKINKLEKENEELKTQIDLGKREATSPSGLYESASDAEIVCLEQLRRLRDVAITTELTLEETKKLEIYARVLQSIRGKLGKDTGQEKIDKMDDGQLLQFLNEAASESK